jgi:hypothetical protein
MTPEQWERVKELFEAASSLDAKQQDAFISAACEDDEIRAEVKSLVSEHKQLGSFIEKPVLPSLPPPSDKPSRSLTA